MHSIAHYGLGLGIITSALGALVLCLLVFRYGFTPPDDESPEERSRRQFVTRLGHAAGAVCFAITAGLSAIVLSVSTRTPVATPAPAPAVAAVTPADLDTLRSEDIQLGESVHTLGTRVTDVEAALQRLRASATETTAKLERLERMATTPRVTAAVPAPEMKRPVVERTEPEPPAPRRSLSLESHVPAVIRPASTPASPPRPVSLPAPEVTTPEPTPPPSPQATVSPALPPPAAEPAAAPRTAAVSEPATRSRRPSTEPNTIDEAARGVVRLGDSIMRGLVNAGNTIRRFVEDLQ